MELYERYQELRWRGKAREENFPNRLEDPETRFQWYSAGVEAVLKLAEETQNPEEFRENILEFLKYSHPNYQK